MHGDAPLSPTLGGPDSSGEAPGGDGGLSFGPAGLIWGVFTSPTRAFAALRQRPRVLGTLLVLVGALFLLSLAIAPTAAKDQVELMRQSPRLSGLLSDAQLEEMGHPSPAKVAGGSLGSIGFQILGFAIVAWLIHLLGSLAGGQAPYKAIFGGVVLAGFISPFLGGLFLLPLILAKGTTLGVTASLALLAPDASITSLPYLILSAADLFSLWAAAALAVGVAALYGFGMGKAAFIVFTVWVLKSAASVGLQLVSLKLAGLA